MPAGIAGAAGEGQIEEFFVFSNYDKKDKTGEKKSIDIKQGIIELVVTESILDNTGQRHVPEHTACFIQINRLDITNGLVVFGALFF